MISIITVLVYFLVHLGAAQIFTKKNENLEPIATFLLFLMASFFLVYFSAFAGIKLIYSFSLSLIFSTVYCCINFSTLRSLKIRFTPAALTGILLFLFSIILLSQRNIYIYDEFNWATMAKSLWYSQSIQNLYLGDPHFKEYYLFKIFLWSSSNLFSTQFNFSIGAIIEWTFRILK